MKKVILFALLGLSVMGADYGSMSLDELQAMKGRVPVEERAAFQKEMQSRMQGLSPEDRREAAVSKRKKRPSPRCAVGSRMHNSAQCANKKFRDGQKQ